ncbi:MAG: Na/Pi cotransporter family protein [Candidatus Marinimicrobia bacterium]|nr:Na/Pi cotransporter family protein [Candidatus Neomarinimicrobiota bacterium]
MEVIAIIFKKPIARILILTLAVSAYAASSSSSPDGEISWSFLIMWLMGGLSLFLIGMEKMSEGLKKAAGDKMRNILSVLTKNRVMGIAVGAFVTMVIQSSSATTVMLVSFVQAQLMTFAQSIGVILGANIGTTVTAQLIAFNLTDYALLMITVGFLLTTLSKNENQKNIGDAILGFGILFFGMKLMSDAMKPLRTFEPFIDMLKDLENPLLGLLVGAVFTALIQSSSALTGIVIVLAQQGVLSIDAGIPIILGANVGTCVTAGLASIGTSREAKRVAIAHVIFNVTGAAIFIFLVPWLADLVRFISPVSNLSGIDKLASETPRQIANAHTIFNLSLGIIFLPFTKTLSKFIFRIYPEKSQELGIAPTTEFINEVALGTPALALDLARSEIARMAKILGRMVNGITRPFFMKDPGMDEFMPQLTFAEGIEMREGKIDYLDHRITTFLLSLSQKEVNDKQASEIFTMISIVRHLESIGDVISKNMMPLVAKKKALKLDFSKEGKEELEVYHQKVLHQIHRLRDAFAELDPVTAQKLMRKQAKYSNLEAKYTAFHLARVQESRNESIKTHEIHMELLDMMKLINVYTGDIGKLIFDLSEKQQEE